jgi:hypothetical protein
MTTETAVNILKGWGLDPKIERFSTATSCAEIYRSCAGEDEQYLELTEAIAVVFSL